MIHMKEYPTPRFSGGRLSASMASNAGWYMWLRLETTTATMMTLQSHAKI